MEKRGVFRNFTIVAMDAQEKYGGEKGRQNICIF